MSAQSGLLHTWSHLHKAMKTSLRRFSSYDFEALSKLQHVHLPSFFGQITDRGVFIGSALKMRFLARYDDRLPLVIRANAELLRPAVSLMLDYAMDRHIGVGYTTFAAHLAEEDDQDYVSFNIWHSGVSGSGDQGMRSWFSRNEMEEFAARMGGYFLAKDQHGAETRYALRIPLIPGDPSLVEQTPLAAKAAGRVGAEYGVAALVVDDSAISRALGVYMLSWHNIAAESVESGAAALKKLSAKRYDLIFMDYSLPGLNGIQSAAMLREKALPQVGLIIGMIPGAGFAKKNMKAAFLQAGMQACLDKPVDPRELNQLLAELLPRVYEQRAEASETDADGLGPSRTRGGAGG
ncbi:MAG: response regulator, partial [Desulfovibrionaceae bacterium]|nr:response regulator [Desulfovibrionaceae bacterium]